MATCRAIVEKALVTAAIVPIGDTPEADEADYGMGCLQGLFDVWVAGGMFGRLTDVYETAAYTAKEGERVHTSGSPVVTIPDTYAEDGEAGTDRPPYDLSLIEVQDGATRNVWLYDRNDWVDLRGLVLADTCPLSDRGEHGLACCVAELAVAPFGRELPRSVVLAAATFKQAISHKYGSTRPARTNDYF